MSRAVRGSRAAVTPAVSTTLSKSGRSPSRSVWRVPATPLAVSTSVNGWRAAVTPAVSATLSKSCRLRSTGRSAGRFVSHGAAVRLSVGQMASSLGPGPAKGSHPAPPVDLRGSSLMQWPVTGALSTSALLRVGRLFPSSSASPQPWWSCSLCDFRVFTSSDLGVWRGTHSKLRQRHLLHVHGVKSPPCVPRSSIWSQAKRLATRTAVASKRVAVVRSAYLARRWIGGHRVGVLDSDLQFISQGRKTLWRCADCHRWIRFGDTPVDKCVRDSRRTYAKLTPKAQRNQIWADCQAVGRLEGARLARLRTQSGRPGHLAGRRRRGALDVRGS